MATLPAMELKDTLRAQVRLEPAKLLIVEDEGIIARSISMMVLELGYKVSGIAASGAEAMELARTQAIDLVLMDIHIQGNIDGIQTAALLVQEHRLPIVFLTAHTDDNTLARARDVAPFGYIGKPMTSTDLKLGIAVALTRYDAQRQVEEREQWLNAVVESTTEAMIITAADGRITFLNRAASEITGKHNSAACGRSLDNVLKLLDKEGSPQPVLPSGDQIGKLQSKVIIGSLYRPDQAPRQVLVSLAPIRAESGSGMVVVMHDMTAHWTREQALQSSNEKFIDSHDLLEKQEQEESLYQRRREQLQGITAASNRMSSVMSSLMEYLRAANIDRSEMKLLNANGPFREALFNLEGAIEASQAQIQAPVLPFVYAHPTALMLIFQNLIGNAIQYRNQQPPSIAISSTLEGDFWKFSVEDNGSGFEPTQAERIFELFNRADGSDEDGSGIGLATCRRLVEQHAGTIWAESIEGIGSKFHFTLPVNELRV